MVCGHRCMCCCVGLHMHLYLPVLLDAMELRDTQGMHSRFRDLHLFIIVPWDTGCVPRAKAESEMLVLNNELKTGSPLTC